MTAPTHAVFSADGDTTFASLAEAEAWLAERGFVRRPQPGQYVVLDAVTGNRFACLRALVAADWKPNHGAMARKAIDGA